MLYKNIGNTIVVRLEVGDEIVSSVKEICTRENLKSAVIHGIGAVRSARVGLFNFQTGVYKENEFNQPMELTSLEGSMTKMNGETYIHLHANFGDSEGRVLGGHLSHSVIGATAEIFILPLGEEIDRFYSDEIKLNLLRL